MLLLSRPPTRSRTLLETSNQIWAQVTNDQLTHASNDSMSQLGGEVEQCNETEQ